MPKLKGLTDVIRGDYARIYGIGTIKVDYEKVVIALKSTAPSKRKSI